MYIYVNKLLYIVAATILLRILPESQFMLCSNGMQITKLIQFFHKHMWNRNRKCLLTRKNIPKAMFIQITYSSN